MEGQVLKVGAVLLAGAIIAWPWCGPLPVVMVIVAIVMAISYLTDLIVVVLDPRLRTTIRAAQEEHS